MKSFFFAIALGVLLIGFALPVHAARLSFVSDTVSDSRPSFPADHTIVFRIPNAVPASGKIVVAFENTSFPLGTLLGYQDIDFAVSPFSPSSGFIDRNLAATPDAANDGVAVTPMTGPITITLSSGSGIPAGSYLRLPIGTNASFGGQGVNQIVNPSSTGSYRIFINTYNASGAPQDDGATIVAILTAIGVDVNTNKITPPVLSNGMPTGTIPSNVSGVLLSLNTDTFANCRYATSPGVSYDSMTNNFTHNSLGTLQTVTVSGIVQGAVYSFYVRCVDFAGNKNPSDYLISFTAGDPTGTGSGGGTNGGPAAPPSPSGGGGGGGGGGAPYPAAPPPTSLVMKGVAFPNGTIAVFEDGKKISAPASADFAGNFLITIPSLTQGTHSFTVQALDEAGNRISSYTTTLTLISGTTNSVTGIAMPPSIVLAKNTIAPGGTIIIAGLSEPSSTVEIWISSQKNLQDVVKEATLADQNGVWSYALHTTGFPVDTYSIRARATVAELGASDFSDPAYLGVGQAPVPKSGNGDINGDGRVNLVDFSILLFHWGQRYAPADLNSDGTVNLIDFSILLFHWTG